MKSLCFLHVSTKSFSVIHLGAAQRMIQYCAHRQELSGLVAWEVLPVQGTFLRGQEAGKRRLTRRWLDEVVGGGRI